VDNKHELAAKLHIAMNEAKIGEFVLKCIQAKRSNYATFVKLKMPVKAKELFSMTPQEELFSEFFNSEKTLVKDMTILELRAHREELAKIAFEARARLTAVDDEEKGRKKKKGEVTGFSTSLQTDELTTNAINNIEARKKKLSKDEKLIAGMAKLGIDAKAAQSIMSAGTLLARMKSKSPADVESVKPVVNPFSKRLEPTDSIEVTITETDAVIITKTEQVETKLFINPFAKRD